MDRIIFLTRSLNYGGSERQLIGLAKALWSRKTPVSVVTFYPDGSLAQDLRSVGVPLQSLDKLSRWNVAGFVVRLVKAIRQMEPAILHGYLSTANILTVLIKPFCPRVKIAWGVRASDMQLEQYGRIDQIQSWIETLLSRFADIIIVNSQAGLTTALRKGFPRHKMIVIPNGIDSQRFRPNPELRDKMRAQWGVASHERVVGLVGRLDPMKGHRVFIKAAGLLAQGSPHVRFVCVGDGPEEYKRELMELSHNAHLGQRLMWVGAQDDVEAVYNALDVLASCSSYGEGFSNVIGEAMACGVACVVTDVGDAKEIVGDTGIVVARDDAGALVHAWLTILSREDGQRHEMSVMVRKRIVEHYSVERLVTATITALNTLSRGNGEEASST
ncbi:putative Lipopolysaccharide core biosynthesis glycosyltransferase [Nitrospira sp. KM1]|uniref:glycosyltransferase n=1 Tax=Nitrospira sp. KM1 TaxID=1936990 RepID=UPI0013A78BCD|nr:glycosyltransferase [Nitrospira sp. KM1]BCA54210.1 putative Lipopolysaccharide core biosynthesis glycosyltransferase [Nitrospira sp. KM1]